MSIEIGAFPDNEASKIPDENLSGALSSAYKR